MRDTLEKQASIFFIIMKKQDIQLWLGDCREVMRDLIEKGVKVDLTELHLLTIICVPITALVTGVLIYSRMLHNVYMT